MGGNKKKGEVEGMERKLRGLCLELGADDVISIGGGGRL
jgi:hypothetical protein